jgi:antagonist of KipI
MSLEVIKPGLLTTVQDLGRPGFQHDGVMVNGPMDAAAHQLANLLVGNDDHAAALEITLHGPVLIFDRDTLVAITGADIAVTAGGVAVPSWRPVLVRGGVSLEFGECRAGCRATLAVRGGLDVPVVLGSRSTCLRSRWGGWQGRALRAGDVLPIGESGPVPVPGLAQQLAAGGAPFVTTPWSAAHAAPPASAAMATIRVTTGRQWHEFSPEARRRFLEGIYAVGLDSDRMGCRLQGPVIARAATGDLLSEGVAFGTIQVPPDGQPIILLADRPTVGGYPKLAQAATADLALLAQRRPREHVRFALITLAQSQELCLACEHGRQTLRQSLAARLAS